MKTLVTLIVLSICLPLSTALSQTNPPKVYTAFIYPMKGGKIKGTLYKVHDLAIEVKNRKGNTIVPVETIRIITVRKKNAELTGLLVGTGLGMLVGGILGSAAYPEPDQDSFEIFGPGFYVISGMVLGVLIGGGVGDSIGRKGYRVRIIGEQKNFEEQKVTLRQFQLASE